MLSTTSRPKAARAFTLVELMIVVAIIGVLAALAIYGVRRYLSSSKTTEAKNAIGAICRAAQSSYEREAPSSEALPEGTDSAKFAHQLCLSASPVPSGVPKGRKYQPNGTEGKDYRTGTDAVGWRCLGFEISQPHYYQYAYTKDGSPMAPANPAPCAQDCFEAGARGDLDGDGAQSAFARTGQINVGTARVKMATQIYVENETE
jgi:type IV pilus assembly protein PilA